MTGAPCSKVFFGIWNGTGVNQQEMRCSDKHQLTLANHSLIIHQRVEPNYGTIAGLNSPELVQLLFGDIQQFLTGTEQVHTGLCMDFCMHTRNTCNYITNCGPRRGGGGRGHGSDDSALDKGECQMKENAWARIQSCAHKMSIYSSHLFYLKKKIHTRPMIVTL